MKKIGLVFLVILFGIMLIAPVMAADEHSDNNIAIVAHWISMALIILVVILTFMAAGMFSESLGRAMKFIGAGMLVLGINSVMEELAHFEVMVIPEGLAHSITYHALGAIGYILMAYGFYRVYTVAKGVAKKR